MFLKDGRTLVLEAFGATEARVIDPEAAGGRAIWKWGDLLEAYDGRLLALSLSILYPVDWMAKNRRRAIGCCVRFSEMCGSIGT